ncbi:hypothetical protein NE237_021856 [Protea cynaroides]|uniref:Uncharacterized protein n=1 Tax=Protea cynaroides TaxID=273540 RepID=A0A9Q0HB06_9MAGN|nr:hypothetical protein NE237_021856 [Protea cynaroides]
MHGMSEAPSWRGLWSFQIHSACLDSCRESKPASESWPLNLNNRSVFAFYPITTRGSVTNFDFLNRIEELADIFSCRRVFSHLSDLWRIGLTEEVVRGRNGKQESKNQD